MQDLARQEKVRDPIWRDWSAVYEKTIDTCRWTRELVKERMLESQKVFRVMAGRIGPSEYGTAMPEPLKDDMDRWWMSSADEDQRKLDAQEQNRTRFAPTLEQCSRSDGALYFQWRYLSGTTFDRGSHNGPLLALNLYLQCMESHEGFPQSLKARGIHPSTGYRHLDQAFLAIAIGLMRDLVPNGVVEMDDRPQRQDIIVLPDWWYEVELLMGCKDETPADRLKMSDILIGRRVKDELDGRSLSNKLTLAEYRGRCNFLQRLLRERIGMRAS